MWELEDADDERFIVTFSEVFAYISIFLVLLCCNFPFLAVYYAMIGYHIVFQEDDTDAIMQRDRISLLLMLVYIRLWRGLIMRCLMLR